MAKISGYWKHFALLPSRVLCLRMRNVNMCCIRMCFVTLYCVRMCYVSKFNVKMYHVKMCYICGCVS